jgi:hypothetical protein
VGFSGYSIVQGFAPQSYELGQEARVHSKGDITAQAMFVEDILGLTIR